MFMIGLRAQAKADEAAAHARAMMHRASRADKALEMRIDALELSMAAIWEFMKEQHGYTDEHLIAKITEVDARDGTVDGKIGGRAENCQNCGRPALTKRRDKCLWCGGNVPARAF
jgi:hypothetical protein